MTTRVNDRAAVRTDATVLSAPPDLTVPVGPGAPILDVLRTMRAMRRLAPEPVARDLLEQLIQAAIWAPNAMNEQTYSYVVVTDRAVMAELAQLWREVHRRYMNVMRQLQIGERGRRAAAVGAALQYQAENFHLTPAVIAVCYQVPRTRWSPVRWLRVARVAGPRFAFRHLSWRHPLLTAASSSYPAAQNLLLAARTLGLAANLTAWHLYDEEAFRRVLGVPKDVVIFALIPVGYPLGRFGPVRRRPVAAVLHWENWNS